MQNDEQKANEAKDSLDSSLEYAPDRQAASQNDSQPLPEAPVTTTVPDKKNPIKRFLDHFTKKSSVYLPLFGLLLIAVIVVTIIAYNHGQTTNTPIADQNLSPSQLNNLANSNEVVGNSNEVLSVQSSSIFNGQVLVRKNLQVAGTLKVGGSLNLPGISVSGNSIFSQLQVANNVAIGGNANIQGGLTVQKDLSVNGSGSFSGGLSAPQIAINSLQLNGDLNLTHHINAGGPIPSRSSGGAVGAGGTTSISGSDSAGMVTINTGSGPAAGCYITVNFVYPFSTTPDVVITPVGSASASLNYYVNRSNTSFSVCAINTPQPAQTYSFDYLIMD